MARRAPPPVSYGDDLELPVAAPPTAAASTLVVTADPQSTKDDNSAPSSRRPILDKSAPTLVYLHPEGKHQLRHYAVAQGLKVKVHDLLLEAMEEWGAKRGLTGPWRVEPSKPRRG